MASSSSVLLKKREGKGNNIHSTADSSVSSPPRTPSYLRVQVELRQQQTVYRLRWPVIIWLQSSGVPVGLVFMLSADLPSHFLFSHSATRRFVTLFTKATVEKHWANIISLEKLFYVLVCKIHIYHNIVQTPYGSGVQVLCATHWHRTVTPASVRPCWLHLCLH